MKITKYALRNVLRAKGRSILIAVLIVVISFAMCIGLCIKQSAKDAKESALADMTITATISPDREGGMEGGQMEQGETPQMASFLTLDEMKEYAEADSVQSFYYTMSIYASETDATSAYTTSNSSSDSSSSSNSNGDGNAPGGMNMDMGDFTVIGYSSDESMTQFTDGTCTITDGQVFETDTSEAVCVISDELASYDGISVGDSITLANTSDSDETYTFKVVGIYNNSQASAQAGQFNMGMSMVDPANNIYTSYNALSSIVEGSDNLNATTEGTYVLGDLDAYESFCDEVEAMGLDDGYTVSSEDISNYERSAEPLENLSKFAGYFLIVIIAIGIVVLAVFNIFSIRERKYEVGVLTAIGMRKKKVVQLFISEILIIAIAGTIIGGGIGAITSVPVTNKLLTYQTQSQNDNKDAKDQAFGREFNEGGPQDGGDGAAANDSSSDSSATNSEMAEKPDDNGGGMPFAESISKVTSAVDVGVLAELLLLSIAIAVISAMASVVMIMRYDPLEILSNRD